LAILPTLCLASFGALKSCLLKLGIDPLFGSLDAIDDAGFLVVEEARPFWLFAQSGGMAHDHQAVSGPSDSHINTFLLLNEGADICADHGDENEVELAPLRAVDGQNLVLDVLLGEVLGDGVLLRVVGRDDVHGVLCELHEGALRLKVVLYCRLIELLQTEILQLHYNVNLSHVEEGGASDLLHAIRHVDEQERVVTEHELFVGFSLIAALDPIFVKEEVWDVHEGAVHAILHVEEVKGVVRLD